MRRILIIGVILFCFLPLPAKSLKDFWISMPDSIVPYLNMSMRTELVEYTDMKMAASVKNRLDGTTSIDTLTENYLSVTLSESSTMQIRRIPYQGDSIFCVVKTYLGPVADSRIEFYTGEWTKAHLQKVYDGLDFDNVKQLLINKPNDMTQQRFDEIVLMIDPIFVHATLSETMDELVLNGNTIMLKKDEKDEVMSVFVKIKYKWDGKVFKKVI